jgi:hypothetical protein
LGVYESLILGTQQLTLVLVSLLLFSKSILSELPPHINAGIFPAVLFILLASSILLPWKRGSRLLEVRCDSLLRCVCFSAAFSLPRSCVYTGGLTSLYSITEPPIAAH